MRNRIITIAFILFSIASCVSDKEEGVYISDQTLFNLAQNVSSFTYYKNDTDTLTADPSSPHKFFVRVRFNPKASTAMGQSMSGLIVSEFPDESMIVKEVYDEKGGPLKFYAIMYKLHNAANSGSGWVWNELYPDGNVFTSASTKGDECIACHSLDVNSDLVRTFGLH